MPNLNERINITIVYGLLSLFYVFVFIVFDLVWVEWGSLTNISLHFFEGLIFVVSFPTLKKTFQLFIDRNFYRRWYLLRKKFLHLNRMIDSDLDYEKLTNDVFTELVNILSGDNAILYLRDKKYFRPARWTGSDKPSVILSKDDALAMTFRHKVRVIDLRLKRLGDEYWKTHSELFQSGYVKNQFRLIFPFHSKRKLVGFMLIGNELNGYTDTIESRKLILRTTSRAALGFENAKLYQNAQRESLQREALFEVGKRISSSLNLAQVLDLIITELKQVVPYDAAGIFLIHKGSQEIDFENLQGVDPDKMDRVKLRLGQGIVGDVAKTGRPEIVGDVHKDPRYIEVRSKTRSEMVVPLMQDNEVVGLFALESDEPDAYSKKDLNLAQAFASQAAIAIENARLYQDSKRMRRLENELLVASKIQRALLPKAAPKIAGISISATNQPSLTMGGDLFDLIKFNDKHLGLAIGDVVGKGTQAAMLMAVLYAGFRSQVRMQYQPSEVVAKLNLLICESTAEGKYASFFYGMIDTGKKTITYTNAGHNAPIVFKNNGEFHNLQVGGTVLGFLENASFEQTTVSLHSGDVIVFYTDGITETFNEQDELFGEQRLHNLVSQNLDKTPIEIKKIILQAVENFRGTKPQYDDITALIVKIH